METMLVNDAWTYIRTIDKEGRMSHAHVKKGTAETP